jgi:DNA-binding IclR family transcriptional regulator
MAQTHQRVHDGFDRFQELLLAMRAGDELRASDAARLTGLSQDVCLSVLDGLKRAGLMTHQGDDRFVRKTLDVMAS